MTSALRAEINQALDKLHNAIYNSFANSASVNISTGHTLTCSKIRCRSGRVAWRSWYGMQQEGVGIIFGGLTKVELRRMVIKRLSQIAEVVV